MIVPIAYLADTPSLEGAMMRIERQFAMDGLEVKNIQPIGYGRFRVDLNMTSHVYEWSHINGTKRIF